MSCVVCAPKSRITTDWVANGCFVLDLGCKNEFLRFGSDCKDDATKWPLSFYELGEHLLRVDGDENTATASQDFVLFVEDFGRVDVAAAVDFEFVAFNTQGLMQRNGLQVFDCHLFGEGHHVAQFVDFAHGVVEDAGNDAAVAVARRSGITVCQAEVTHEGLSRFVEDELEPHAIWVVRTADKTVVLLHFGVLGFVTVGFAFHEEF